MRPSLRMLNNNISLYKASNCLYDDCDIVLLLVPRSVLGGSGNHTRILHYFVKSQRHLVGSALLVVAARLDTLINCALLCV